MSIYTVSMKFILFPCLLFCWSDGGVLFGSQQDLTDSEAKKDDQVFEIVPLDDSAPDGFEGAFAKQVDVFGVKFFATESTPDSKILHAANVMAEYLDNDADGVPDNEKVIAAMQESKAAMIMAASEREFEKLEDQLMELVSEETIDSMVLQALWGEETHPNGAEEGVFDASLEEVLHLITHAGYSRAYPEVFGERRGSELANAMDEARGGYFARVPRRYPDEAWYSYDDRTCDYGCQCTEYIYWGLTSLLGAQSFAGRGEEIEHEWRLNTPEKFTEGDPGLHALLTNPDYRMPSRLPVGRYRPRSN